MNTLIAKNKAKVTIREQSSLQLFVTDKGFTYVVPMKIQSDVLQAIKHFTKAVGAPDVIICDTYKAQTPQL